MARAEVGLRGALRAEVHAGEAAGRVVVPAPAARIDLRAPECVAERALHVFALPRADRRVEGVAEADVDEPVAGRALLRGEPVDRQCQVVGALSADGRGIAVVLDAGAVPHDVVAERLEQEREGAVEMEAVAAAMPAEDAVGGLVRVDRGPPAELDLQRLVRDPLHMRAM